MVAVQIRRNYVALLVISMVMSPTIIEYFVASTPVLGLTENIIPYRDGFTADFFAAMLDQYMREINNQPPLVHLIIDAAADTQDNLGEMVVETCSEFGITVRVFLINGCNDNETNVETFDSVDQICAGCSKFEYVIAIFDNPEAVECNCWRIAHKKIWNSAAHFAILINNVSVNESTADRLLRNFWALDCPNVVIACTEQSLLSSSMARGVTIGKIYSYDPFHQSIDRKYGGTISYDLKSRGVLLFPKKMKNLRGRVIKTSLYPHEPHARLNSMTQDLEEAKGLDVEILRYVAKRLNFTIRLRSGKVDAASHVVYLPGGKAVGPIGDILTGKSDYLANGQFLDILHRYNSSLESIYPRSRSRSVVVVRKEPALSIFVHWSNRSAREERQDGRAWFVVLAGGLGLIAMIIYLRVLKRRTSGETLVGLTLLLVFQRLPKIGRLSSERIFCVACVYGCFVACTVYQGNLVNHLTSPPIFNNIDTLRELVERVKSLRLMVRPYERRILISRVAVTENKNNCTVTTLLSESAHVQLNFSACLTLMKEAGNVACSIDESHGKYVLGHAMRAGHCQRIMLENNQNYGGVSAIGRLDLLPPIHILDESLVDFWKTYFVRRGFPYLTAIDDAITSAVEFGLVDKWHRDDTRFEDSEDSGKPRALGLSNMNYIFGVLIVGYAVATVAFICEIALARIEPLFNKKLGIFSSRNRRIRRKRDECL